MQTDTRNYIDVRIENLERRLAAFEERYAKEKLDTANETLARIERKLNERDRRI